MQLRSGPIDNLFQRISNSVVIVYAAFLVLWLVSQSGVSYDSWSALFGAGWFKVFSIIALIFACLNSLLAGWQIGGDYIKKVPFAWFGGVFTLVYVGLTAIAFLFGLYVLFVV